MRQCLHEYGQLGKVLDSDAFEGWSKALAIILIVIWLLSTAITITGMVTATLLALEQFWSSGPCHKVDIAQQRQARRNDGTVKQ
jgi:hypothetical protein